MRERRPAAAFVTGSPDVARSVRPMRYLPDAFVLVAERGVCERGLPGGHRVDATS
jgi:hypothetical protein